MVRESKTGDKKLYQCEECEFHYSIRKKAEECEKWCAEKRSCNLKIVKYAVENKK